MLGCPVPLKGHLQSPRHRIAAREPAGHGAILFQSRISSVDTFGFPHELWNAATSEARDAMIECARNQGTLSYTELVSKVSSIQLEPHDVRLDRLLEFVARDEESAGRGILTVVVVHKTGDMLPGSGFFELAEQLGRDTLDRIACWIAELKRVHAQWS